MQQQEEAQGVILGCTEKFLLVDQSDAPHTKLLCQAAVDSALGDDVNNEKCRNKDFHYTVDEIPADSLDFPLGVECAYTLPTARTVRYTGIYTPIGLSINGWNNKCNRINQVHAYGLVALMGSFTLAPKNKKNATPITPQQPIKAACQTQTLGAKPCYALADDGPRQDLLLPHLMARPLLPCVS